MRAAGYERRTMDIAILVDTSLENEARICRALEVLPDKAVRELQPGEIAKYTVVRVADEVVVDLIRAACGIAYAEATKEIEYREVDDVRISFASPRLLWRMKAPTRREKDMADLLYLREYFAARGETPPDIS